jgi:hypothetical protein
MIVLDHLGGTAEAFERNQALVDVIFLPYLRQFIGGGVLDLIIHDRLNGWDARATAAHLWSTFVLSERAPHPVKPLTDGGSFGPDRFTAGGQHTDYVMMSSARSGTVRTYRVFHEFLFPHSRPPAVVSRQAVLGVLSRLNVY